MSKLLVNIGEKSCIFLQDLSIFSQKQPRVSQDPSLYLYNHWTTVHTSWPIPYFPWSTPHITILPNSSWYILPQPFWSISNLSWSKPQTLFIHNLCTNTFSDPLFAFCTCKVLHRLDLESKVCVEELVHILEVPDNTWAGLLPITKGFKPQ